MIVQLQHGQVSAFWDVIKECMVKVNRIPEGLAMDYSNKQLENILSGKLQCWLLYEIENGQRMLHALMITRIIDKQNYGIKLLSIETMYGFRYSSPELYSEAAAKFKVFAKNTGCNMITADTRVQRIKDMLTANGFEEQFTTYRIDV